MVREDVYCHVLLFDRGGLCHHLVLSYDCMGGN